MAAGQRLPVGFGYLPECSSLRPPGDSEVGTDQRLRVAYRRHPVRATDGPHGGARVAARKRMPGAERGVKKVRCEFVRVPVALRAAVL